MDDETKAACGGEDGTILAGELKACVEKHLDENPGSEAEDAVA